MAPQRISYRGPSTLALLGLLFVGLKLGGCIAWSWWWVILPFYAIPAVCLAIVAVALLLAGAAVAIKP